MQVGTDPFQTPFDVHFSDVFPVKPYPEEQMKYAKESGRRRPANSLLWIPTYVALPSAIDRVLLHVAKKVRNKK